MKAGISRRQSANLKEKRKRFALIGERCETGKDGAKFGKKIIAHELGHFFALI
jgi:hypothetical protein